MRNETVAHFFLSSSLHPHVWSIYGCAAYVLSVYVLVSLVCIMKFVPHQLRLAAIVFVDGVSRHGTRFTPVPVLIRRWVFSGNQTTKQTGTVAQKDVCPLNFVSASDHDDHCRKFLFYVQLGGMRRQTPFHLGFASRHIYLSFTWHSWSPCVLSYPNVRNICVV